MKGGKTKGPEKPMAPYMRYSRKVSIYNKLFWKIINSRKCYLKNKNT